MKIQIVNEITGEVIYVDEFENIEDVVDAAMSKGISLAGEGRRLVVRCTNLQRVGFMTNKKFNEGE